MVQWRRTKRATIDVRPALNLRSDTAMQKRRMEQTKLPAGMLNAYEFLEKLRRNGWKMIFNGSKIEGT